MLRVYLQKLVQVRQGQAKTPQEQANAQAAVTASGQKLLSARKAADDAQREMDQITQIIETSQDSNSPLWKSKDFLQAARVARHHTVAPHNGTTTENGAPPSPDEAAAESKRAGDRFAQVRAEDPAITQAEVSLARKKYDALRRELCQADPRWIAARDKLSAAHHDELMAEKDLHDNRLDKLCTGGRIPGAALR